MAVVGISDEMPTLVKMILASKVGVDNAESLMAMKESGSLDVVVSTLDTIDSLVNVGIGVFTGKAAFDIIKKIPELGLKGIDLIEKLSIYLNRNSLHIKPKTVDAVLHQLGEQLKDYSEQVEKYNIAKERKLLAVQKPKAPPFIVAQGIIDLLKKAIYHNEKGSDIIEYAASVL
jgi:hypothetical protein